MGTNVYAQQKVTYMKTRYLFVAPTAIVVLAIIGVTVAIADRGQSEGPTTTLPAEPNPGLSAELFDGSGPVSFEIGPVESAPDNGAPAYLRAWKRHELRIRNNTDKTVYLDDRRGGSFIGNNKQLAIADGCGFGGSEGQDVDIACTLDLRMPQIKPGDVLTSDIWIAKELRGMGQLTNGSYTYQISVTYQDQVDPMASPRIALAPTKTTKTATITYTVTGV
jgi:hypothetical protein